MLNIARYVGHTRGVQKVLQVDMLN